MLNSPSFVGDDEATTGLPIRIVVLLIVGAVGLAVILSAIPKDIVPKTMSAVVTSGSIVDLNSVNSGSAQITVKVTDIDGSPVGDAYVMLSGLGGAGHNKTNAGGVTVIDDVGTLKLSGYEGYLKLTVKASGYRDYVNEYAVKVVS